MRAGSNLEKVLEAGHFAVTAEISPPISADPGQIIRSARTLKGYADAFNLTDNQTAIVRLSSLASSIICLREGAEPVMQMVCRDRNRIAMQSDLLGASALGIRNLLCLSGDHQVFGDQPESKNVYDVDSIQQLLIFRKMRDERRLWGGTEMQQGPRVFLGAAANPFSDPLEFRVTRLAKKVAAGADFIQTQAVFDMDRFENWMKEARAWGLDEKVHILAGLVPLKSVGAARHMRERVPGVVIPDEIVERMRKASEPRREGIKICLEQIEHLRTIKGVHGVHIMAVSWEEKVPEIVREAGLLPRPLL